MKLKFATKAYAITHLTLGMLLHYLGKLKIQIFCWYSADMEENANKLHFECTDEYPSSIWYLTDSPVGLRLVCWLKTKLLTVSTFSSVRALCGLPLPGRLSTVPRVSRNFLNSLLTSRLFPAFLRKFVCQPLCTPSNTNFLSKSCPCHWIPFWLLTNSAVTSAVTNFRCRKLIAIVNNQKNSDVEKITCNQYGERVVF